MSNFTRKISIALLYLFLPTFLLAQPTTLDPICDSGYVTTQVNSITHSAVTDITFFSLNGEDRTSQYGAGSFFVHNPAQDAYMQLNFAADLGSGTKNWSMQLYFKSDSTASPFVEVNAQNDYASHWHLYALEGEGTLTNQEDAEALTITANTGQALQMGLYANAIHDETGFYVNLIWRNAQNQSGTLRLRANAPTDCPEETEVPPIEIVDNCSNGFSTSDLTSITHPSVTDLTLFSLNGEDRTATFESGSHLIYNPDEEAKIWARFRADLGNGLRTWDLNLLFEPDAVASPFIEVPAQNEHASSWSLFKLKENGSLNSADNAEQFTVETSNQSGLQIGVYANAIHDELGLYVNLVWKNSQGQSGTLRIRANAPTRCEEDDCPPGIFRYALSNAVADPSVARYESQHGMRLRYLLNYSSGTTFDFLEESYLEIYEDGTAQIFGKAIVSGNGYTWSGFNFDGTTWDVSIPLRPAAHARPLRELKSPEIHQPVSLTDVWKFFVIDPAESGAHHMVREGFPQDHIDLTSLRGRRRYAFQVGEAANGKNLEVGASGWVKFNASIDFSGNGSQYGCRAHRGFGSLNMNLEMLCEGVEQNPVDSEEEVTVEISVFPNPFVDQVTVSTTNMVDGTEVQYYLYNRYQRLVRYGSQALVQGQLNLDFSSLPYSWRPNQTYFLILVVNGEIVKRSILKRQ